MTAATAVAISGLGASGGGSPRTIAASNPASAAASTRTQVATPSPNHVNT